LAAPRIGCLAWGSLLWDPRTLPLAAVFLPDGPLLPIEFSRVALDGRVTLVIDPRAKAVRTFWAPLAVESLAAGVGALALREGVTPERIGDWIGVETRAGLEGGAGESPESVRTAIAEWLAVKPLDAVVWTALPARTPDGRFERPDRAVLVDHLERLEGTARERAEQYIRRAPERLRTPNRLHFEAVFGWSPQGGTPGGE
jgi:hypothetical protein